MAFCQRIAPTSRKGWRAVNSWENRARNPVRLPNSRTLLDVQHTSFALGCLLYHSLPNGSASGNRSLYLMGLASGTSIFGRFGNATWRPLALVLLVAYCPLAYRSFHRTIWHLLVKA